MDILLLFYKNGLWLSWPLLGLGVYLLWFFIAAVVKLEPRHRICRLPLTAEQSVAFSEAGQVVLWMEGPLFSTRCRGLSFELTGIDGLLLKGRMILFRQSSSGFTKGCITLRTFTIPYPGRFTLHTKGLGEPKTGDELHSLIFMRPHLPQTVGCILGIILGAFLAIGSIVNFFLRLAEEGGL